MSHSLYYFPRTQECSLQVDVNYIILFLRGKFLYNFLRTSNTCVIEKHINAAKCLDCICSIKDEQTSSCDTSPAKYVILSSFAPMVFFILFAASDSSF